MSGSINCVSPGSRIDSPATSDPRLACLGANADDYFARHPEKAPADETDIEGVFVGQVKPNSVAQKAGIQPGDVIQALANKRVRNMIALDQIMDLRQGGRPRQRALASRQPRMSIVTAGFQRLQNRPIARA